MVEWEFISIPQLASSEPSVQSALKSQRFFLAMHLASPGQKNWLAAHGVVVGLAVVGGGRVGNGLNDGLQP